MAAVNLLESFFTTTSSTTAILIAVLIVIISLLLISQLNIRYLLNPGPWGIPILGFYPFLRKGDYQVHLTELSAKYGDVYAFSLFGRKYLHLGSHKSLREALVSKSDCFIGRPQDFSIFQHVFQDGIFYINGDEWKAIRKYLLQGMKELGIGPKEQIKNPLSSSIQTTLDYLRENEGKPINIATFLLTQCTEVIRKLILGEDLTFETSQLLQKTYLECDPTPSVENLLVGNIAKHLVLKWTPDYNRMIIAKKKLIGILKKIVEEHETVFDFENPKDLIDIYLRDKKLKEKKDDPHAKFFTDIALISTIIQAYGDGGSGIGALTSYFLSLLTQNEKAQDELYDEIRSEIGLNRLPTYEDRTRLPLMNSVIKEMERNFASFVAITSLEACCDTTVSGVYVPKGSIVVTNLHAVHTNPNTYKDPEKFDHTRFLMDDTGKKVREELPIAFGIGKRSCAGESLVSTEVFVFLTSIIQNFKIQAASEEMIKSAKIEAKGPMDCVLIATPRESNADKHFRLVTAASDDFYYHV